MLGYKEIFNERGRLYSLAMKNVNHARFLERENLIKGLDIKMGDCFLDVPAGEGYLSDAIYQITPNIICLEPSHEFSCQISNKYKVVSSPIDKMDIKDESVDAMGSLAGLHHLGVKELEGFFREGFRVLKHGGEFAVADVEKGSNIDYFLNYIVDKFSETGHQGYFFSEEDFVDHLNNAGFKNANSCKQDFYWIFDDITQMLYFVKNLFGLTKVKEPELLNILAETLGFIRQDKKIKLNWSLIYAFAPSRINKIYDQLIFIIVFLWGLILYPKVLIRSWRKTGKVLFFSAPETANEKFLWRKLIDHAPHFTELSDKLLSKK